MLRQLRVLAALVLLCAIAGCFDVSDEVWWNADGSAKLRRTIRLTFTPDTAETKAKAITEAGDYARIALFRDQHFRPLFKELDVKATPEGANVVVVEELDVEQAAALSTVQAEVAKLVKVEGAPMFSWCPGFTFEKLPTGNSRFQASLLEVKPPPTFDRDTAKATFGERVYTLKLTGSGPVVSAPSAAAIAGSSVEWRTLLSDIAQGTVREPELLAEVGPPPSAMGPIVIGAALLVLLVGAVVRRSRRPKTERTRPPAPRVMPEVFESGPIPTVASDEALLSSAGEINVETDEQIAPNPDVLAQAAAAGVVKFKCPKCQVELKVPLHLAGRQGKCRKCGGAFVSPVPPQLKQVRAQVQTGPPAEAASLRDAFSVKKVKCACGVTSAVLKGRSEGEERCPACNQVLVVA